ncbi:hypothetical protein BC936DRAFT_144277 [Jimgerdemannia flammicorona]|uniref:Uncharacterized protein n=1 Tax=Jimgerdemannia flammicorona TaxID=994334 RepID=A0A432ZXZ0_9FUNG|nr:hypothetical protein BC936DRAFT_144277 [Jimgerdemannia flammicorona]
MAESIDMVDMESSPPSHVVATYSPAAFKSLHSCTPPVIDLSSWFLSIVSDWLQGPYLYKLYQFYGYQMFDIAFLFMAGFVSGAVFTTIMGGVADSW